MAIQTTQKPTGATLWAFQVGFGDCLLLGVAYGKKKTRFVLFDCGTKKMPSAGVGKPKASIAHVAQQVVDVVKKTPGGELVALIATHRHQDHISGFDGAAGKLLESLAPKVIVRPWMDDPKAAKNARGPAKAKGIVSAVHPAFAAVDDVGFSPAALDAVHSSAEHAFAELSAFKGRGVKGLGAVAEKAHNATKNPGANKLLNKLAAAGAADYVYTGGGAPNLTRVLPGVKVRVLGPPTIDQMGKSYAKASDEYWNIRAAAADEHAFWAQTALVRRFSAKAAASPPKGRRPPQSLLFPRAKTANVPPQARWIVPKLQRQSRDSLLSMVEGLDSILNNTSVNLLLTIGKTRLLFPGDAQLESWKVALGDKVAAKDVTQANLYKVGHHGSLNATPKKLLWERLVNKNKKGAARLTTVLSTLPGFFGGKKKADTEVPRKPLVAALKAESTLYTTDKAKEPVVVEIPVSNAICDAFACSISRALAFSRWPT